MSEFQEAQEQVTASDVESSSSDVKPDVSADEADDKVPLQNRYKELQRKYANLEERLDDISSKLASKDAEPLTDLRGQYATNPQVQFQQPVSVQQSNFQEKEISSERLEELRNADPIKYANLLAELAAQKATINTSQLLLKEKYDNAAFSDFPDLKRPNSVLTQEVRRVLSEFVSLGRDTTKDPLALYDAAEKAHSRLIRSGRLNTTNTEQRRQDLVSSGSGVSSRTPTPSSNSNELSDSQKFWQYKMAEFGVKMDNKKYKEELKSFEKSLEKEKTLRGK